MPAKRKQLGQVYKRNGFWRVRYYDEHGGRRRMPGRFRTKDEAAEAARTKVRQVEGVRAGLPAEAPARKEIPTLAGLVAEHAAQHVAEANTKRTLAARLKYATEEWGDVRIDRLDPRAIAAWRARLPAGSAWHIHKALRQVLSYAVRMKLLEENPAVAVQNPEPKRREVVPFQSRADLDGDRDKKPGLLAELEVRERAIVELAVGTGLRPEEWIALERGDVDRKAGVVHVRRVFVDGQLREYGKTARARRRVPLPRRVVDALELLPPRLDTRVLFPGTRGPYIDLAAWRRNHWTPAVKSAGLHVDEDGQPLKRSPYSMRHTFASWAIAAGVSLFDLSRVMGTSVDQLDRTYGHLLGDSLDRVRGALDRYGAAGEEESATQV